MFGYTLNLVNPEDPLSLKYEISKFPDGQQSIRILENGFSSTYNSISKTDKPIMIRSRLNNFKDLEIIICANQALKELGAKEIELYVPYFIGARSDRKFQLGSINYIKTVIAPIINLQGFKKVMVLDPHSDVLEACINNFVKMYNYPLIKHALTKIDNKNDAQERIVLVSPDAGALKKIYDTAHEFSINKIITGTKVRDLKTGKIVNTDIPSLKGNFCMEPDQKFVIVDDICDGGRTFIELAKAIRLQRPDAEIYLIVTHGIFSNGLYELSQNFKRVFCTNSVKQYDDVEYASDYTVDKEFIDQFNVF